VLTLSVTVMLAVREPVVLGANVTSIVPLSVGASELGQRWVGVKLSPECVAVGVRGPRVPKVIPQLPAVSSRPELVAVVRFANRASLKATALSTAPSSPKQLSLAPAPRSSLEQSPISSTADRFTVFYETNAASNRFKHLLKQCEKLEGSSAWGRSNRIGSWLFP
jgi:hypothetical protein